MPIETQSPAAVEAAAKAAAQPDAQAKAPEVKPQAEPQKEAPKDMASAKEFMKNSLKLGHTEKVISDANEKKAEAKKDEGKEEKKPEEAPKVEAKPEPKKKPAQRRSEPIDVEDITRAATEAATKATIEATRQHVPDNKAVGDEDPNIPDDYAADLPVLKELEKLMPGKYAKISEKFVKSAKSAASYKSKWEKEHPGQEFDPNDSEHDEFYEGNEVSYDEKDFQKALVSAEARKIVEESRKEDRKEIDELRSKHSAMELAPVVEREANARVSDLIADAAPELKDIVSKGLTEESINQLVEKDPVVGDIVAGAAVNLRDFTRASMLLMSPKASVKYDPADHMHQEVYEFLVETEREMSALPPEDQMFNGRKFVPRPTYLKMMAENPKKAEHLWTFTAEHLAEIRAAKAAKFTKAAIENRRAMVEKQAKQMGYGRVDATPKTPEKKNEVDANADINPKGQGPSGLGKTAISPVKTGEVPGSKGVQESFKSALRGRL